MAALTLAVFAAVPATASAAGCEVIADARDRADCVARQTARNVARAQVERQVEDATGSPGTTGSTGSTGRSAAWDRALQQADGVRADELFDLRLLAAVGGLVWFTLALRARRRHARAETRR